MKRILRVAAIVLAIVLGIGAATAIVKRDEITRLLAVNSLFEADKIVHNFSNMDALFWTVEVPRGDGPVSPLPVGADIPLPPEAQQWIKDRSVTAMVILKDGQIRHESYYLGTAAADRRISWSVAKSFLSALMGVVLDQGAIDSLEDQVTKYVPSLIGSAYDGARIIDVLRMSSGVKFNEDYLDFNSDINKMGRTLGLGGSMDKFAASIDERIGAPGERWKYVSIDTHVLAMVIRGATGRSIPDLMAEYIIGPLGLEQSPLQITDAYGTAFALGGLNMRTRDYARFGQMVAQGGVWQGKRILPEGWVETSTKPSAPTKPGRFQYGLQWWAPADATEGEFFAIGVYGQYIYIDRANGVVIAVNAADRKFKNDGVDTGNIAMFRTITDAVANGG